MKKQPLINKTLKTMNKLSLTIASELTNLREVEHFIEKTIKEFELPEHIRGKITLSIREAVNNSILYGNKRDSQKLVKLTVVRNRKKVIFTIEDEGEGFDFKSIPDPTTPENLEKATGRGLYLMTHLTDELLFAKNGAMVIMIFSLIG